MNLFSELTSKLYGGFAVALALLAAVFWWQWHRIEAKYDALTGQAGAVLASLRIAADNPGLKMKDAPGQAVALGESVRALKVSIAQQNESIAQMAREAVRLRANAARLREIADKAQAQRQSAFAKLSDLSITPGTRDDCMTLLREADEALNIARDTGL
jgi:hypothetical protein